MLAGGPRLGSSRASLPSWQLQNNLLGDQAQHADYEHGAGDGRLRSALLKRRNMQTRRHRRWRDQYRQALKNHRQSLFPERDVGEDLQLCLPVPMWRSRPVLDGLPNDETTPDYTKWMLTDGGVRCST